MRWSKFAKLAALPTLWLITAGLMVRDYLADPFDPLLVGTAAYGHNGEGALRQGLIMTLVELAVVSVILRPWSYERSWGRAAVAATLLSPWAMLSMVMVMHAGGILVIHFFWVGILAAGLSITAIGDGIEATRGRSAGSARANARET